MKLDAIDSTLNKLQKAVNRPNLVHVPWHHWLSFGHWSTCTSSAQFAPKGTNGSTEHPLKDQEEKEFLENIDVKETQLQELYTRILNHVRSLKLKNF